MQRAGLAAGGGFVDRGDLAAHDWTQATLTIDSAYHDLDLSGIIPLGTKLVLFRVRMSDDVTAQGFNLKTKGDVNEINRVESNTQVANIYIADDKFVVPDANRKVEYKITTGVNNVYLNVGGWWV